MNSKFSQELSQLIDKHYESKEKPEPTETPAEKLQQEKVTAVVRTAQILEEDLNGVLDVLAIMAKVAKKKTTATGMALQALLNEQPPEPEEEKKEDGNR
jgi:hypothetical protein